MSLRILHLPTATGGNAWGLAQAEKQLGLKSDVLLLQDSSMQYPADRVLFSEALNSSSTKLTTLLPRLAEALSLRKQYDVFHFNFGSSLIDHPRLGLALADLPLFDLPGKKICVTYNGCDARQKYPTMQRVAVAACHEAACYGGMCNSGSLDRERQHKIKKFERYADQIFAVNPDLLYFLPPSARFLPYTVARWQELETQPWRPPGPRLRIVHAPSNRVAKGSGYILAALDKLAAAYPGRIETTLIEGLSQAEALEAYRSADLVIDQVMIGWYGAVAVEAMKLGKPVMAFVRAEDLDKLPAGMAEACRAAVIQAERDTIYESLCRVLEQPELLRQHRQAGLDYVTTWHAPAYVAGLTRAAYEA